MKVFKSNIFGGENRYESHKKELQMLQMVQHENVIRLIDNVEDGTGIYLVFNFIDRNLADEIYADDYSYDRSRAKSM